ncbi:MAG: fibronectin type III domain-containing protein [Kofleriaceae bacterium]|nr:fibronectin type III domain-containing protein [Kofleriaceae bacterium]
MKLRCTAAAAAFTVASLAGQGLRLPVAVAGQGCRVVDVDFTPTEQLQIVAWIEDASGNYVDTIYITQSIGTYGLGNRPGIAEFNSGPKWPYGRREMVFPIWANRHGMEFPLLGFQNSAAPADANDKNLSHPFNQSSKDPHFCRPLASNEPAWDTGTCASQSYSDKGVFSATLKSKYPPREDVPKTSYDSVSVNEFAAMNPFDAVSKATPPGGVLAQINWPIPTGLATGQYTLFVETSKEFDHNGFYTVAKYPAPPLAAWSEYGEPFRGQPSVVYKVPFTISDTGTVASTDAYVGYGAVNGEDGVLRDPDNTISTTTPGSGAARLSLTSQDGSMYRVRVTARPEFDAANPGAPSDATVIDITSKSASIAFVAPGDDSNVGKVTSYEIRIRAGEPITDANFATSMPLPVNVIPDDPGQVQMLELSGLLPQTQYFVGIRAYDDCRNESPLLVVPFTTADRTLGEVDACFVATAAYGSLMANDVELLRHFRDSALRTNVLGELFVETYYTFGPAVAGLVGESDDLRVTARQALAPMVAWVKKFAL